MKQDLQIFNLIKKEEERQTTGMELIASENYVSKQVLDALGSICTNKYAEGYPGARYYGGCEIVDQIEQLAIDRLCQLFGVEYANVQPHSGAQANMAVYMSVLKPGDKVLGMNLTAGGHLTHGSPVNFSGRLYRFVPYGIDPATETIDYDELERLAERERPHGIPALRTGRHDEGVRSGARGNAPAGRADVFALQARAAIAAPVVANGTASFR